MDFWKSSSHPGVEPACRAFPRSLVLRMISLNCLSTAKKALDSLGSCLWMSAAEKMDSKYIHCFWHSSHSSRVSEKSRSWLLSLSTSARIPVTNLEARMTLMVTIESSSAAMISSTPPKMKASLSSLNGSTVNSMSCHLSLIFLSIPSSAASWVASVEILAMSSL